MHRAAQGRHYSTAPESHQWQSRAVIIQGGISCYGLFLPSIKKTRADLFMAGYQHAHSSLPPRSGRRRTQTTGELPKAGRAGGRSPELARDSPAAAPGRKRQSLCQRGAWPPRSCSAAMLFASPLLRGLPARLNANLIFCLGVFTKPLDAKNNY